ncbi:MAG: SsrA-binding protein SmpB [Cryomorphaceae bacterium]|nr:SsrA-binding protein SmpB [Cryomorphaceae bacterium]MBT3688513.1 SsrA-binding protein SmpB [Cryomorphaceae bacterium]MBT4221991.1 SsrA-binding protein SmpB [Cryomorphaceae bacterium]MBT4293993.1 SsrA-binding protein SmpB [Cryomorphaceae bacterium]MBT4517563.1 SsrA-binding protein SmpB [Cryomorphaceae bacterium]
MNNSVNINNKKAKYDYSLLDKYTCGIVLNGNEIKSIKNSKASLNNSYCEFEGDELYVINMHVDQYENSSELNYEPKRRRKLLLNRQELKKIQKQVIDVGITVVATSLFITKKGIAKLNISIAKGKREFDKRNVIRERESKISLKRIKKNFNN